MGKKVSLLMMAGLVLFAFMFSGVVLAYEKVVKISHCNPTSHPYHQGLERFKEIVEAKTDLKVEIYPMAQLGDEVEAMESTMTGSIQGCLGSRFRGPTEKLTVGFLPFLIRDYKHADAVLYGPIGEYLKTFAEPLGLKILDYFEDGFRQITNNKRPIYTPADLKGIKIRVPPMEAMKISMKVFGASPTPVSFAELYMSLKTGVCDGQENPLTNIYEKKLYEVQKYLSIADYMYSTGAFFCSLSWFNSLPEDVQKVVLEAAREGGIVNNELQRKGNAELLDKLKELGMKVNYVDAASFEALAEEVWEHFYPVVGEDLVGLIKFTK